MNSPEPFLTLQYQNQQARIAPACGGMLFSYTVENRPVIHFPENAWSLYPKQIYFGSPILFPIAGKVSHNDQLHIYHHQNKSFTLPQHGFARYLPWKLVHHTSDSATLFLASNSLTQLLFPWDFEFQLTYTLSEAGLKTEAQIKNLSSEPMPIHLGFHPYFQLDAPQSAYLLRVPEAEALYLVSGPAADPIKPEAKEILLNSSLAQTRFYEGITQFHFELVNRDSGATTVIEADGNTLPCCALWTAKLDSPYLCVEPWSAPPNALNSGKKMTYLEAHQTWSTYYLVKKL
ncbi:MAG: hypothetical protein K1X66_08330 [Verrucomicrobiae bacterium]|nr:hypothetical protein [Verrucomicrobiae bacterium]